MLRNTSYSFTGCTNWKFNNPSIFHFGGSSLCRQIKQPVKEVSKSPICKLIKCELFIAYKAQLKKTNENTNTYNKSEQKETDNETEQETEQKPKTMSVRTKHKILNKLFALNNISNKLTFVTLTFQNKIDDKQGVKILNTFLTHSRRVLGNYSYLWVAEQQTKNKTNENNLHFHLITDRRWNIPFWLNYWQQLQCLNGVHPINGFASSAFNVKSVNKSQKLFGYVAKYVVKNKSNLKCQLWNCSRSVSNLMTTFNDTQQLMELMSEPKNNTYVSVKTGEVLNIPVKEFEYTFYLKVCNYTRYHTHFQTIRIINKYISNYFNSEPIEKQLNKLEFETNIETALLIKYFCWHKNADT